jgi:hypothetical protein
MSAQATSPLSQPAHTSRRRALYIPDPLPPPWPLYIPRPLHHTPTLRTLSPTYPIVYPCICQRCSNAGNSLCSAPLAIHAIGTSSSLTQAEPPLKISPLHPRQRHNVTTPTTRAMPLRAERPIVRVEHSSMRTIETRSTENLFGLWSGE